MDTDVQAEDDADVLAVGQVEAQQVTYHMQPQLHPDYTLR